MLVDSRDKCAYQVMFFFFLEYFLCKYIQQNCDNTLTSAQSNVRSETVDSTEHIPRAIFNLYEAIVYVSIEVSTLSFSLQKFLFVFTISPI